MCPSKIGVQFDNINDGGMFSMQSVLQMLALDFVLYGFMGWYLDQVTPLFRSVIVYIYPT